MTVLSARGLHAQYITRFGNIYAVNNVSLEVSAGEIVGIVGESGSGKSTLAKVIMMNVKPPLYLIKGEVYLEDMLLNKLSREELKKSIWGKRIALIPQSVMNALNPTTKVKDLIKDVLFSHGMKFDEKTLSSIIVKRFEELGLSHDVLDLYPFELSGGMRQRVAITISTLFNPALLIADEPVSALDVSSQKKVLKLIKDLLDKNIVGSIIFITHDITVVRQIAHRLVVMYAGKILEEGPLEKVLFNPLHPYTELLVNSVLTPEPEIRKRSLLEVTGKPPDLKKPPILCPFISRCPYVREICLREPPPLIINGDRKVYCWLYSDR